MNDEFISVHRWTRDEIKALLLKNPCAVERGLVAIYNCQTKDEKHMDNTYVTNHVGFSAAHVRMGSYMAKWILGGRHLSGRYKKKGLEYALHYIRQLTDIANARVRKNVSDDLARVQSVIARPLGTV